jgi:hypothetical protein
MTRRSGLAKATDRIVGRGTRTLVGTDRRQGRETKAGRLAALAVALNAEPSTHAEIADPFDPPRGPGEEEIPEGIVGTDTEDGHLLEDEPETRWAASPREPPADIIFTRPGRRLSPHQRERSITGPAFGLSYRVTRGSVELEADPLLLSRLENQEAWLQRVAGVLARHQRDSVLAATPAEAFEALEPWTQKAMATAADTTAEELSRNSWRVVVTAGGARLPLALFWWNKPDQADLLRPIRDASVALLSQPGLADAEIARRNAAKDQADRLRKMLPALRAVIGQPYVIRRHRRAFPVVDLGAAMSELGLGSADRGALVVLLAIVGFIAPMESGARN